MHTHSPCSKYRRLEKRKSRLVGNLPPVDALNLLRFSPPVGSIAPRSPLQRYPSSVHEQFPYLFCVDPYSRNEWHEQGVPRIKTPMRARSLGRVTAVLAPIVTILVTFLVAVPILVVPPASFSSAQGVI